MEVDALNVKSVIQKIITQTETLIPKTLLPDLPPTDLTPEVPEWHDFEYKIWELGEKIRQVLVKYPSLRKDKELQDSFARISINPNAKRGRQSFIMLLGYKNSSSHSKEIASQLYDPFVDGQVIFTLRKMQVGEFVDEIRPFLNSNYAWKRNEAKKYLARFDNNK